jgi:hypothetical protein
VCLRHASPLAEWEGAKTKMETSRKVSKKGLKKTILRKGSSQFKNSKPRLKVAKHLPFVKVTTDTYQF